MTADISAWPRAPRLPGRAILAPRERTAPPQPRARLVSSFRVSAKKKLQQLVQAYHLNDLVTLEALLEAGVDPDAAPPGPGGDTLLMLAVRQERREAAHLLVAHGASALISSTR